MIDPASVLGHGAEPDALHGRVQRILRERAYGFIRCTTPGDYSGRDFFFHASGLVDRDIESLEEGTVVLFDLRETPKGLRAERVQVDV